MQCSRTTVALSANVEVNIFKIRITGNNLYYFAFHAFRSNIKLIMFFE